MEGRLKTAFRRQDGNRRICRTAGIRTVRPSESKCFPQRKQTFRRPCPFLL
ncbi:hypothetical protein NEIELOOT_00034 [Neisseria elongata subsp. glycolytica ATCC 29315]|uniref:Uncharacterized protein n=1 Tax=Neisseria elongata subsp. glycolytica ATCC 29315 TaxID=546263 RepID=D4DLX5_NEIEG|nr:hypothetical protein NEIELOOT_00034 [Neisseria elongata subsp. glycolytica ATCC 29315]